MRRLRPRTSRALRMPCDLTSASRPPSVAANRSHTQKEYVRSHSAEPSIATMRSL
jgi:hypothetical protein